MVATEETRLLPATGDGSGARRASICCFSYIFTNTFVMGMHLGIPNPMIVSVTETMRLDSWQIGSVVAAGPIFTAIASLGAGWLADRCGRRVVAVLSTLVGLLGGVVLVLAMDFEHLMLGRCLHGASVGAVMVSSALYTAEASPSRWRGSLGTVTEVFINLGMFFVIAGAYGLSHGLEIEAHSDWRWLVAVSVVFALFLLPGAFFLPETPRWYASQHRWPEAVATLESLLPDKEEVKQVSDELAAQGGFHQDSRGERSSDVGVIDKARMLFFLDPPLRAPMIQAQGISFFHHFTGITVPGTFSTLLLTATYGKRTAMLGAVVLFAFKFLAIIVSTVLVDSAGRRPLLLSSGFIMAVGYALWAATEGALLWTLTALVLTVVGFSIGIGPLNYVIPGEVLPLSVRAWGVAACNVTARITEAAVSLAALPAIETFGLATCLVVLTLNCLTSMLFFWFAMPEKAQMIVEKSSMVA